MTTSTSLVGRFTGPDGHRNLVEALRQQSVIEHDATLAERLASKGSLREFQVGENIVVFGGTDTDLYFVLDGEVDVIVNERHVARRGAKQCIGEMVLMDPSARRSATVRAYSKTVAWQVAESDFVRLSEEFPRIYKPIAKVLAERLRERGKFHRAPNPTPVLFIGSSVEGLPIAKQIVLGLKHAKVIPQIWSTPGVFGAGGVPIDVLMKQVDASDFAAFVFGPDDKITSRGEDYVGPRDNVVFELGLFMGKLDRTRAFVVKEHSSDVKIPTDLLGVTPITYVSKAGQNNATMIETVCVELMNIIDTLGVL